MMYIRRKAMSKSKKSSQRSNKPLNAVKKEQIKEPPKSSGLNIRKSNELTKPYFAGIDILKIIAVIFVIWVHSFLYNGFYGIPINDEKYLAPIACRWIAYSCVPIFMTITGYLMKNKKLSGKYYLGILRVVVIYIVVSFICMRYKHEHFDTEYTLWTALRGFLQNYDNAQYGWYLNYYFAIFCMIPFLNLAFNGLANRKQRFALVATVTIISIVARSFYIGFDPADQIRVFPDYLNGLWPVAYYYAGAYIREYPPKRCIRNKLLTLIVLVTAIAFLTYSTYNHSIENIDANRNFLSRHFNDYGTYPVFIVAVCIFLLFFDIKTRNKKVKFVLRQLGDATFCTYLMSYIFDQEYYTNKLYKLYPNAADGTWNYDRFTHSYEGIGYIFIRAMFWALVIQNAYNLLEFLVKRGINKLKGNEPATNVQKNDS